MSVRVVVLCEDQQLATFIRRFLKKRGWTSHQIRESLAPDGKGSGEQWVREHYPDELQTLREHNRRKGKGLSVLVVGTDADARSVKERATSLDDACTKRDIPPRTPEEPVLYVIPKRNIETWFAYLRGNEVNEESPYPRYEHETNCSGDVSALDEMCRNQQLRLPAPPSLQRACEEFGRMPGPTFP